MATYLFTYHGGDMPSEAEAEQVTQDWISWFSSIGEGVVDGGNPVGRAASIAPDGTVNNALTNWVGGYSVIKADSFEQAVEWAQSCPQLKSGGSVEVGETFDVM